MGKRRPSGNGMVRKRKDGRWEGRIVVGHKADGSSIFRYLYADTQKELTAKLRQSIDAYQGVDLTEDSRMTLSEWLDQWLERRMAGTVRPNTLEGYRRDMDRHVKPYLGGKPLAKVTADDLSGLYRTLLERGRTVVREGGGPGLSPATVRGINATLHHAFEAAVEEGLSPLIRRTMRRRPGWNAPPERSSTANSWSGSGRRPTGTRSGGPAWDQIS